VTCPPALCTDSGVHLLFLFLPFAHLFIDGTSATVLTYTGSNALDELISNLWHVRLSFCTRDPLLISYRMPSFFQKFGCECVHSFDPTVLNCVLPRFPFSQSDHNAVFISFSMVKFDMNKAVKR